MSEPQPIRWWLVLPALVWTGSLWGQPPPPREARRPDAAQHYNPAPPLPSGLTAAPAGRSAAVRADPAPNPPAALPPPRARPGSLLSPSQPRSQPSAEKTPLPSRLSDLSSPPSRPRASPPKAAEQPRDAPDRGARRQLTFAPVPAEQQVGPVFIETLEQAWATALAVDQQLAAAAANVRAASESLHAADAERWPLASVGGHYTLRDNEPSFRIDTPILPFTFDNPYLQDEDVSFEARVMMPLYTGGKTTSQIAASAAELRQRGHERDTTRQQVMIRVAREYFGVLRAEQDLDVAVSHERSLEGHYRDIRARFECQQVARNDLLAAEVALHDSRHQVIQTRNRLDIARAAYNRRLGRPLHADVILTLPRLEPPSMDVDQLTDMALAARPELARLDARMKALNCLAAAVLGENRAQVNLEAAYRFRENQFQAPEGITSAAVGVSWNLFDGGRVRGRSEAYRQQAHALMHLRADLQSQIRLQVRRAWLDVQEAQDRVRVTRESIDRAEENFRVTQQRYRRGLATNTDVLSAEALRVVALQNHNHAVLDSLLSVVELRRALGSL